MGEQLHKKFLDEEVKSLLERYLSKEIKIEYILQILGIKRRRFFELLNEYRNNPDSFTIQYKRKIKRRIKKSLEKLILKELKKEKEMIENKEIPLRTYNYSYIRDQIFKKYEEDVSVPTIIKWRQVLFDCNVEVTYALSPQAKGKIERPYQ